MPDTRGTLIIIGGHENKSDHHRKILRRVAQEAGDGPLVVSSLASSLPEQEFSNYLSIFRELGVGEVELLGVKSRHDALEDEPVRKIREASLVFFTGGDQLRIASQLAGTPVYDCLEERHLSGMPIAGTSAGAAVMPETMIVSGPSEESYAMSVLGMAPGLGLVQGVVIDSHFAERGRFGRLLGAVTENPRNIGVGIDENTAIVLTPDNIFEVIGSGAVYVMDGTGISYSSLSERPEGTASVFGVQLHVLAEGDRFDLHARRPHAPDEGE